MTAACLSAANDAIGEAFRENKFGMHDVVLVGGAGSFDSTISIEWFQLCPYGPFSGLEDPEQLIYSI